MFYLLQKNVYMKVDTGFEKKHKMFGENYVPIMKIIQSQHLFQRSVKKTQAICPRSPELLLTIPKYYIF